jgi:hypothetical protein
MALKLEKINLIIPIKNIGLCYPGGFALFREHNQGMFGEMYWHDMHLFREGAMNLTEIEPLILSWQKRGLVPYVETDGVKKWKDMCVIESRQAAPTLPCDWIEIDQANNCVFLKKRPKGRIIGREEMRIFYGQP